MKTVFEDYDLWKVVENGYTIYDDFKVSHSCFMARDAGNRKNKM